MQAERPQPATEPFHQANQNYRPAPLAYSQPNQMGQPFRCPHCMSPYPPRVEMQTVERPKPKEPDPPKEEEPPPPEPPKPQPKSKAPPPPEAAPVAEAEPAPDFGFAMGSGDGPGGIAVPMAKPVAEKAPVRATEKKLQAATPKPTAGTCGEEEVKAKPVSPTQPAYTAEGQAAGVEGKVKVRITVDAEGKVTDVQLVEGLGHGLDESAIATVRTWRFNPATKCGKSVSSSFTVNVRFVLG